jgi:hypothetical protein
MDGPTSGCERATDIALKTITINVAGLQKGEMIANLDKCYLEYQV